LNQLGANGITNNVGYGRFNVTLDNGTNVYNTRDSLIAVSGLNSPTGTVTSPLLRRLTQTTPPQRQNDSEAKILEAIASRIIASGVQADSQGKYSGVRGTIQLFTERKPCDECTPLILSKWKELFPNVKINEVLHGPRFLAPGRPSDLEDVSNFTNVLP
jgi:filamentous hemagglutinin